MKTCHPPKENFTRLPDSKRKDRHELRFVCQCGERWQYTEAAGYYQVKKKTFKSMIMFTARIPVELQAEIREYVKKRKARFLEIQNSPT